MIGVDKTYRGLKEQEKHVCRKKKTVYTLNYRWLAFTDRWYVIRTYHNKSLTRPSVYVARYSSSVVAFRNTTSELEAEKPHLSWKQAAEPYCKKSKYIQKQQ